MGCLLIVIAATTPRFAMFVFWLLRPERVDAAFDSALVPLAGLLVLPTTTLLYAVLDSSGEGVGGWGWFWIAVAACIDLVHGAATFSGVRSNNDTSLIG